MDRKGKKEGLPGCSVGCYYRICLGPSEGPKGEEDAVKAFFKILFLFFK